MTILVADIGGTNCRLALGDSRLLPQSLTRYANLGFPDFSSAARHFLTEQGHPKLDGICIAVAGPVAAGHASLTNHDWDFSEDALAEEFGVPARIVNDLLALGHALPHLQDDSLHSLRDAPRPTPNGQALVLGLGTGVNTCGVVLAQGKALPIAAEAGHQSLPLPLAEALQARGLAPTATLTCEDLFSGRGLATLHQRLTGALRAPSSLPGAALVGDAEAAATLQFFAELLGLWAQEIALQSLPRNGLYLAGSVARGLIDAGFGKSYARAFADPLRLAGVLDTIPLQLITDDMAALWGCLAAAPKG